MLSFQAAYTAPIIMMSQNRQSYIDRQNANYDCQVNIKAELEIELLHDKMNLLREVEIVELRQLLKKQQQYLEQIEDFLHQLDTAGASNGLKSTHQHQHDNHAEI